MKLEEILGFQQDLDLIVPQKRPDDDSIFPFRINPEVHDPSNHGSIKEPHLFTGH